MQDIFWIFSGFLLAVGAVHLYFWNIRREDRSFLFFGLTAFFAGMYYLGFQISGIEFLVVLSAAVFYGLYPWLAGELTGGKNKKIQLLLSSGLALAFVMYLIDPHLPWSEVGSIAIFATLLYGFGISLQAYRTERKLNRLFLLVLTGICLILVVDEILYWSTGYRNSFGFMPLDMYPILFSFLMNWRLIETFVSNSAAPVNTEEYLFENTPLVEVERKHILQVLAATSWKINGEEGAAEVLKMHPNTLRSRMKKLEISRPIEEELV